MKKDFISSIRMTSALRMALTRAARKERRTVASLLDKIILDYLESEGFVDATIIGSDRRKFKRVPSVLPATSRVNLDSGVEEHACVILNLSMGGVLVGFPKGSTVKLSMEGTLPHFELCFQLPKTSNTVHFDCRAHRINDTEGGIQVGAMFANSPSKHSQLLDAYLSSQL